MQTMTAVWKAGFSQFSWEYIKTKEHLAPSTLCIQLSWLAALTILQNNIKLYDIVITTDTIICCTHTNQYEYIYLRLRVVGILIRDINYLIIKDMLKYNGMHYISPMFYRGNRTVERNRSGRELVL